ncbi:MAG: tRNA (N6-isopentenyl adenosine(37)-C2)-methylthiotransferase MiaB [Armatimonadota bacterium]|nr:tRNA (N6-isopentenyl adenosine(37)-C2)-methylthiotransferase MiaB [bacterium]
MTTSNRNFIVYTWGCQMNEDDAEQIANLLMQMGYSQTDSPEEADVAMLVTCSVREKPEDKAKSMLGRLRDIKSERPGMIIGVCGCMAQREGEKLKRGRPYLDLVIGTANIWQIPDLIRQVQARRRFTSALDLPETSSDPLTTPTRIDREGDALKSFVPVMYGCNNFCAYCVVPYVRGRERSRPLDEIVLEIHDLARKGRREVTLLGQNVNSYGSTLDTKVDFADLLRAVSAVPGIERIRFTTSHPKDLSDRLIDAMRELQNVCEHIHLAVQSGDDEVLRRMNRKYTSAHYRERVAALRAAVPDIAITTDFLVGFPGETEEQFQNTIRLAEDIRFDAAFMFAYNVIPNTAAEKMDGQLTRSEKNERLGRLIEVQNRITCEINSSQIGNVYEVLVEGVSPKDKRRITGLTRQNKTVNFKGNPDMVGKMVKVRALEGHLYGFVGELVEVCEPVCA